MAPEESVACQTPTAPRRGCTLRINGDRLEARSGGTCDHISPVTGTEDASIPLADTDEIDLTVTKAHEAFQTWKRTPPAVRRELLVKLAGLIEANAAEFGRLGALDNGTPVSVGSAFLMLSAEWTRYYAGWADKIQGDSTGNPVQDASWATPWFSPTAWSASSSRGTARSSRWR